MRTTVFLAGLAFWLACAGAVRAEDTPPPAPPAPATDLATAPAAAPSSANPAGSIEELQKQLTDNQDKLATALHSYEILNQENQQLKADAEKFASEKAALQSQIDELQRSNSFYQAQSSIVGQVDSLHMQLRQAQGQTATLAAENSELRTRLAFSGAPGANAMQPPTRPGALVAPPLPPPVAAASSAQVAPAAPARVYVVVDGDTLSKISKQYYGTANRWDEILKTNHGILKDENHLQAGMKLTIP